MKKLIFLLLGFFLWQSALSQVYVLTNKGAGFVKFGGATLVTGSPDSVIVSASAVVDSNIFATRYWVGTQTGGSFIASAGQVYLGTVVGILMGLTLAALFWGKL